MRAHRAFLFLSLLAAPAPAQSPTLEQLQQRAVADSNDPATHYQLAMAYWDKKNWDAAEASLRTATRIAPSYADAYLALGALGSARGEKYWKHLAKQHGDSVAIRALREYGKFYRRAFLLNPLVTLKPLGKYELPGAMFPWLQDTEAGINELYRGNYPRAYQRLESALGDFHRLDPRGANTPVVLLWNHALAAAHVDSFDVAARDFDNLYAQADLAEIKHPERVSPLLANDYRFFVSTMLYLGGHFDRAVLGFKQCLENDISLYVAHVQLARMYEASDMWDQAIAERRSALDANPEDPGLMVELAATLLRREQRDEAVTLLDQAGTLNPRDARIPYLRGYAALSAGNPQDARQLFSRFLSIAPSSFAPQIRQVRADLEKLP